jgi:hypothetical protein
MKDPEFMGPPAPLKQSFSPFAAKTAPTLPPAKESDDPVIRLQERIRQAGHKTSPQGWS